MPAIPSAQSIPWAQAVRDDGTFRSPDELRALYEGKSVTPDKAVTAYCRIGERSAHTWFVLRELLGHGDVKNYDGSWTEWGNLVDVPRARRLAPGPGPRPPLGARGPLAETLAARRARRGDAFVPRV